jgi:hypothetical protein
MTGTVSSSFVPERLSSGTVGSVLVVDFQPYSTGKRLGELIAAGAPDRTVQQIEPARDLAARHDYLGLDELADEYASSCRVAGDPADAVLVGYCSAAVLAVRLAERLASSRVILLRPTWPDTAMIADTLADVRAEIGAAGEPAPELVGAAPDVLGRLSDTLHRELQALANLHSLDPTSRLVLELLERYQGWFGYLLAARAAVDELRGRADRSPVDLLTLADSAEQAAVPGLTTGSYRRRLVHLPDAPAELATAELARLLLAELD